MDKNAHSDNYICVSKPFGSPIGELLLCAVVTEKHREGALAAVMMKDQKYYMEPCEKMSKDLGLEVMAEEECPEAQGVFAAAREWLGRYFAGDRVEYSDLKCEVYLHGSEFRQKVWDILKEIPYGETVTYGAIAKRLEAEASAEAGESGESGETKGIGEPGEAGETRAKRMSAQAVGGAVGHNPVGIIVPCHRVLGTKGQLTGYAGGLDKKIKLLALEGVIKDDPC